MGAGVCGTTDDDFDGMRLVQTRVLVGTISVFVEPRAAIDYAHIDVQEQLATIPDLNPPKRSRVPQRVVGVRPHVLTRVLPGRVPHGELFVCRLRSDAGEHSFVRNERTLSDRKLCEP